MRLFSCSWSASLRNQLSLCGLLVLALMTAGCGGETPPPDPNAFIFNPVDTTFVTRQLVIPSGKFKVQILYQEGGEERVEWTGGMVPSKGRPEFLAFIPIRGSATHGILWVNHCTATANAQIGDGGGASVMEVFRDSTQGWSVIGFPYAIDFRKVNGTLSNGLGTVTPWGTILSAEEAEPNGSSYLPAVGADTSATRDTSLAGFGQHSMNYGWMVEVDPHKREVLGKRYAMGRFEHGGVYPMPDERTFYLLDHEAPGALFKFVADTARRLGSGQLYAYRHQPDSLGVTWIKLPHGRDSLQHARRVAFQKGASIFFGLKDIELLPDGSLILSEQGSDSIDLTVAQGLGGKLPPHLDRLHVGNKRYEDKFGRLLRYDPKTEKLTVFLEGGQALEDKSIVLSNPGSLALDKERGLLVIQENLNGTTHGRVPVGSGSASMVCNEIYFLDIKLPTVHLDDLRRFAVAPLGFETTGAVFSPDGKSLFFNLRKGTAPGVPPYDRSMTVVVTGFGD